MRRKLTLLALTVGLMLACRSGYSLMETFTTGEDWMTRMSPREKLISVLIPASLLQSYNVPLRHSAGEYISAIDAILAYDPQLGKEDVANIFASAVYKFEPETRPALDSMELQFLRGNTKLVPPRLIILDNEQN